MKFKGRPPKFQDADELEEAIAEYFTECDKKNYPYTVTGLAYTLGISVSSLRDYRNAIDDITVLTQLDESVRHDLSIIVKRAYMLCEQYAERRLLDSKCTKSPVGYIFALKNFGRDFVDKQEIEQSNKNIVVDIEE